MGSIFSRFRQKDESDYEKILSDLDTNIRKAELRLAAIRLREKRVLGFWLVYSVLAWFAYLGVFFLYLHDQYHELSEWGLFAAPLVLGPVVIYLGRHVITVWYKRKKTNEENQLNLLRDSQRMKVEELKKKTAYYTTKTLLERYDPTVRSSSSSSLRGPDGKAGHLNGQPGHSGGMMDPGLRHRGGQPGMPGNRMGAPSGPQQKQQQPPMGMSTGMQARPGQPGPGQPMHNGQPGHMQPPQLMAPQQGGGPPRMPYAPMPPQKHWYDKIVDVIVGDEGPDTKYALICGQCFTHNGLALPNEIDDVQYYCPNCNFFNPSRKRTRMAKLGASLQTPEQTLLQAQGQPLPPSRDVSPAPGGFGGHPRQARQPRRGSRTLEEIDQDVRQSIRESHERRAARESDDDERPMHHRHEAGAPSSSSPSPPPPPVTHLRDSDFKSNWNDDDLPDAVSAADTDELDGAEGESDDGETEGYRVDGQKPVAETSPVTRGRGRRSAAAAGKKKSKNA
ncbi:hypothetical protein DFQ27_004567 [Actinomortierella ambigua]|uniref:Endoplasmic reticulum junction formation protein lunapark n=1 Tax=Actinomortierella ambigua TaxID=1343610 RepID=A0A9P6QMK2_9FUNG|nr:hypothetical protein DFQ27_004567 [Actinomortierella ambigua]